jgi:hypothetical protein
VIHLRRTGPTSLKLRRAGLGISEEVSGFFVNIKRAAGADCINIAEITVSAADIEEIIGDGFGDLMRYGFDICESVVLDFMKAGSFGDGVDGVICQTYIPIAVFAASLADICLYLSNNVLFVTHCFIQYIILPVF